MLSANQKPWYRRMCFLTGVSFLLLTSTMPAEEVPQADTDGVIRIPLLKPSAKYPRNSEGDFVQLADGRLMFVYTRFLNGSDFATSVLAARFSSDGGLTWTNEDKVVVANEGKMNTMSASLLRLQSGRIALFYGRKNSLADCRFYMRISTDEAKTWTEPTLCIPDAGYYIVNNDRVVQLPDGRLVIPAASPAEREFRFIDSQSDRINPSREEAMCYLSDDEGRTWRRSHSVVKPPFDGEYGIEEPAIVQLKDGRLWMLCRTQEGRHYQSFSSDDGETWSTSTPTPLLSPCSPASIERIPQTNDLMLVWNDHRNVDAAHRGRRSPMNVAISRDEGKTWEQNRILGDIPGHEYSYTAIEFVGNRVVLGHNVPGAIQQITLFDVDLLYE